jgi:NRPS condensation-like uncharacterized protein
LTARIPLSPLDQVLFHLDQSPMPWSCHFEVRVPGRLDGERLAAAASAAAARQPMARARLAPYRRRDRRLYWEIPDDPGPVPVEVVDCPDDAAVGEARSALMGRRLDLTGGPPFALTLARRPGGDSLIINLSHTAGDGTSGLLLLGAIARAYEIGDGCHGEQQSHSPGDSPPVTPAEVADLQAELAGRPKPAVKAERRPKPTALVGIAGGRRGLLRWEFRQLRFPAPLTAEILGRRRDGATLNDVLLGSLAVAIRRFNDELGQTPAALSLLMPIDLRPPGRAAEIMSNMFTSIPVPVLADEQSCLDAAQSALAPRTALIKSRRLGGELLDIPSVIGRWPVGILHSLGRILLAIGARLRIGEDAVVITNVGRVEPPDFGAPAGAAIEVWISPPVQMPPGIGVAVATMNGELVITLRYGREQFDAAGAARFLELWRGVLLDGR